MEKRNQNTVVGQMVKSAKITLVKDPELVRKNHLLITRKATKLFIKKGYHLTSMRDISKATRLPIGQLYCYITKKEDILFLVFDQFYSTLEKILQEKTDLSLKNPEEQLKSALHTLLQVGQKFSDELLLRDRESRFLPKRKLKIARKGESRVIRFFEKILIRGNEMGIFYVEDPYFTAGMIVFQASINRWRSWYFSGRYTTEEKIARLEQFILESVLPRKTGKRRAR
jgi:TetR/AcrR family transcriptional regulator, cholesterol catabolism regulator